MACSTTLSRTQRPLTTDARVAVCTALLVSARSPVPPASRRRPDGCCRRQPFVAQHCGTRAGQCLHRPAQHGAIVVTELEGDVAPDPDGVMASRQCAYSVDSDFRKRRRAGVLKNSSATVTVVPSRALTGSAASLVPPSVFSRKARLAALGAAGRSPAARPRQSGQRFAAKTKAGHRFEIVETGDLGRRVPRDGQRQCSVRCRDRRR